MTRLEQPDDPFSKSYIYWTGSFRRDPIGIKILVVFLMLADIVNFLFDLVFVWLYVASTLY